MAIPTSRVKEKAEIKINEEKCTGCGLCVSVCKDFGLELENKKVKSSPNPLFGCIGCGHCMAICPSNAIEIHGRELSPNDLFDLPGQKDAATYEQLLTLLKRRRSIREFKDLPVEHELIEKILDAAKTAPMGLPPSDVNVLILDNQEKVRAFAKDFCDYLDGMKWLVSTWFLALMRPFWGKANDELFRGFVKPLFHTYTNNMRKGVNLVNYDAPLAMYFYGSPYCDPADPVVAATYAMFAAESLGLGTCMLGGVHPLIQSGKRAKKFRESQGIKFPSKEGLFVIFGYPQVTYHKGIQRTFASVVTKK
ncbi:nitroreductase family protein [Candidatus Formimonas warabiya]|uniref:Nitroreductase n=1 Tax=Formimonas warabiya TaxID=1761012 RepID=A0A3G1L0S4_FORW1|nr:nitroreductase family protein [Candidatus Formimonas warabiya]ATW28229.1 nitroreductase [Candidatus Formimonas warabiya]